MFEFLKKKESAPSLQLKGLSQKLLYGFGALVLLAVGAPLAAMALSTVTSLATMGVVGLLIFAGLQALPAMNRWWKIAVLKMLKSSAQMNPVETLQLEYMDRKKAYDTAGQLIVKISARRDSLRERLQEFTDKHKTPDESLERMCGKLSQLTDRLRNSFTETGRKLEEFKRFVERQADRWEIAKETGELAAMLKEVHGGDVTQAFLSDTAIETIRSELNLSFNQLDVILAEEEVRVIASSSAIPMPQLSLAVVKERQGG